MWMTKTTILILAFSGVVLISVGLRLIGSPILTTIMVLIIAITLLVLAGMGLMDMRRLRDWEKETWGDPDQQQGIDIGVIEPGQTLEIRVSVRPVDTGLLVEKADPNTQHVNGNGRA